MLWCDHGLTFDLAVVTLSLKILSGLYLRNCTVLLRKLILGRDIGWGCRCATSWCNLDLTFDLVVVTLSLIILSGLYLGNCKM